MKCFSLILSVIATFLLGACNDGTNTPNPADANMATDLTQDGRPYRDGMNATDGSAALDSETSSDAESLIDGLDARLPADAGIPDGNAPDSNIDADRVDGGVDPIQSRLRLIATPPMTGLDVQGGRVTLRCEHISADGHVLDAPEDLSFGFDSPPATIVDDQWQFSEYGSYTAHCTSESYSSQAKRVSSYVSMVWIIATPTT